ncbi:hypothetical protein ABPG75_004073 [Micractinium tetrahymenae]
MAATAATFTFSADLLLAAFLAVVQVVLTMAPGAYYGRNGTVDVTTRRSLSKISWELLLPAMAWYNIISASNISSVWPFAANAVIGNVLGILLGWVGARLSRTPRHLRSHMAAAGGFGNLNSLPLLIVQAVCNQEDMPFYGELGASCSSAGFGYVALGSAAMQILMFPVAAWLLSTPQEPFVTPATSVLPDWVSRQLSRGFSLRSLRAPSRQLSAAVGRREVAAGNVEGSSGGKPAESPKESLPGSEVGAAALPQPELEEQQQQQQQQQQGSGELQIVVALPSDRLPSGEVDSTGSAHGSSQQQQQLAGALAVQAPPLLHDQPAEAAAQQQSVARQRLWLAWSFFRQYYLQAACIVPALAMAVACITPLRNLLVPDQAAPLGFLMGALYSIEISLLFVTSFILGAVLCRGPGAGGRDLGWRPCVMMALLRMGLMPAVGAVIVIGSNKLGLWTPLNPVFTFVLLLQWAVPTANQMQNLASMHNNNEQAMGTLIFWQYMAACLALPAWMTLYLYLMDKFDLLA